MKAACRIADMQNSESIEVLRIDERAVLPAYQTAGAAAFDFALIEPVTVPPRSVTKVRTGLAIKIPTGYFLQIVARSSSPLKKGLTMANGAAVIDSDYCGPNDEIFLLLLNLTDTQLELPAGERVAQGLILPVLQAQITEVTEMTGTDRGGHGSTGA